MRGGNDDESFIFLLPMLIQKMPLALLELDVGQFFRRARLRPLFHNDGMTVLVVHALVAFRKEVDGGDCLSCHAHLLGFSSKYLPLP